MAKRIENPNADDLGEGGIELSEAEFDQFLKLLEESGAGEGALTAIRDAGFVAPLVRSEANDWAFEFCRMQADIQVLSICREGQFEAMRDFILFRIRHGHWPNKS
jgi:hypothetical protein